MKEVRIGTYIKGDNIFNFNFCTDLSIANKLKFVNSVINILVDEKHYNSIIRDIIFNFYVIDVMTDIDTDEIKKSATFINDVEQLLDETNIVEIVKANAAPTLFDELNNAIDNSLAYLTGIHPNPLNEALSSLIKTLEKKINEVDLNSMMDMAQKFAGMTDNITSESVMNAYLSSDIHKKNLNEIEESKKQRKEFAEDMDKAISAVIKEQN